MYDGKIGGIWHKITADRLKAFANRHAYQFHPAVRVRRITPEDARRRKLVILKKMLPRVSEDEWLWWIDADMMVRRDDYDVATLLSSLPPTIELVVGSKKNNIDASSVLIRNTFRAKTLLNAWLARTHHPRGHDERHDVNWALDDLILRGGSSNRWRSSVYLMKCDVSSSLLACSSYNDERVRQFDVFIRARPCKPVACMRAFSLT